MFNKYDDISQLDLDDCHAILKAFYKKRKKEPDPKRKIKATYTEYRAFITLNLSPLKRDLFSGELMSYHENMWQLATARIGTLSSHARDAVGFTQSAIPDHLKRMQEKYPKEPLFDIPDYDGIDHIYHISKCLKCSFFTPEEISCIFKEFGSRFFERQKDPMIENHILIFMGRQGIGKDYFIDTIFKPLGQFKVDITVNRDMKDFHLALSDSALINISEFDRMLQFDDGTIKDAITRKHTYLRRPYEKSPIRREVRCSFIASVNTLNIFRDPTGNRRYRILELESIDRRYSQDVGIKILAQMKHLSKSKYRIPTELSDKIHKYIEELTPEDPETGILELYKLYFTESIFRNKEHINKKELNLFINDISKTYSVKPYHIFSVLKRNRLSKPSNGQIVYLNPTKLNR